MDGQRGITVKTRDWLEMPQVRKVLKTLNTSADDSSGEVIDGARTASVVTVRERDCGKEKDSHRNHDCSGFIKCGYIHQTCANTHQP